jgi:hypothetical protein
MRRISFMMRQIIAALSLPVRQQPIGPEQLDTFGLCLAQQLIGQLFIDQRPSARRATLGFAGHHRSVLHHVSFREPHCLRPIVRARHLHSR